MKSREILQILSPYGNWSHKNGMQVVDETAAKKMERNFYMSRAVTLWRGLPVYIGHPDDPSSARPNAKIVGRIKRIFSIDGGIAALICYPEEILKKLRSGKIRAISPRWQMESLGDGNFRPVKLISAGLTNNPNIPDSGKIISIDSSDSFLKDAKVSIKKIQKSTELTLRQMRKCSDEIDSMNKAIRESVVSSRISSEDKCGSARDVKKRMGEIASIAQKRSKETGEPYTKSFAFCKRAFESR